MVKNKIRNNILKSKDLEYIKKHYGEAFMLLCRKLFPTIIDHEGKLKEIISEYFEPNKSLAEDIIGQDKTVEFTKFVFSKFNKDEQSVK